ncbi:hypothetical protein SAMN04488518_110197 [Pseudovibrio ascidiaceicola]|uniref:Uncharacterized protein n=1 Tax=Pseudovibrio ascidiaceicola TaxID=285279 RepID=A0A1I4D1U6_9HYPH|nr:hypothetical protein SAMN04488518_110197 [Pseudovibrio ascidiaceicola]
MTDTGKEKCAHTSLRNEVDQLSLSVSHLKKSSLFYECGSE